MRLILPAIILILMPVTIEVAEVGLTIEAQVEVEGQIENNALVFEWEPPEATVTRVKDRWEISFDGYELTQ